jgi:hypothetical protein
VNRELRLKNLGEPIWLTPSDFLSIVGLLIVVLGVFGLPILGFSTTGLPSLLLGVGLILFVGHALGRIGHHVALKHAASSGHGVATILSHSMRGLLGRLLVRGPHDSLRS